MPFILTSDEAKEKSTQQSGWCFTTKALQKQGLNSFQQKQFHQNPN